MPVELIASDATSCPCLHRLSLCLPSGVVLGNAKSTDRSTSPCMGARVTRTTTTAGPASIFWQAQISRKTWSKKLFQATFSRAAQLKHHTYLPAAGENQERESW
jgi:hypothetical protein